MDDDSPGWEMQQDNERRRWDEEHAQLKADPNYEKWLDELYQQVKHNEISSESFRRL